MANKSLDPKKEPVLIAKTFGRKAQDFNTRKKHNRVGASVGTGLGALAGAAVGGAKISKRRLIASMGKKDAITGGVLGTLFGGAIGTRVGLSSARKSINKRTRKDLKAGNYKKGKTYTSKVTGDKYRTAVLGESSIATFLDRKDQIRLFESLVLRRQALANLREAKDDKIVSRRAKKGALVGALAGGGYGAGQWSIVKHAVRPYIKDMVTASDPKIDTKVASGVTSLISKRVGGRHIGSKAVKGALVGAGIGAGAGWIGKHRKRKKK